MAIKIGDIEIGKQILIIAEIGNNHNGDLELAKRLVIEAAAAGADAVKFQTFRADRLVSGSLPVMSHVSGIHQTQRERMKTLEFTPDQWRELKTVADNAGVMFLSTPFDEECADLLEPLVPAYKIASCDLDNIPLIRHVSSKNKPFLISTGMADLSEIEKVLNFVPHDRVILLHCVSMYPTPIEEAHLKNIPFLRKRFNVPVGYSDHTIGTFACTVAAALGAVVIEKHFTLEKTETVGDHRLSADPGDLKHLVENVRLIKKALGPDSKPERFDRESRRHMRRSIYSAKYIRAGENITDGDLSYLRPSGGIPPSEADRVVNCKARADIAPETLIRYDMLERH